MPPASRPIVLTVHDLAYLDYPQMFTRAGLRFFERAFELALADATMVLCSSLATLARCREAGFDDARLRHVPLGVEITPVSEAVVAEALARFGLRRGYVLWTGTVEPRKNLPTLLRAFAAMEGLVDLVLVGPPGWNEDLESILGALPRGVQERIKRLGWVPRDDLAALYAGAGVFCFPSLLEGFGFPVVEAMAHGTPVVTSRGTSTEELAERVAQLLVEVGAGVRRLVRGMDVVRPQFRAATERGGQQECAATLEPADLDHRAAVDIPSQPVEQGGLVELLRDDAVVQLAAREEEGEILEPAGLVRPPPCGRETELTRVADRRGEQRRAARFRPAQTADERLDPASHGKRR